MDLIKSKEPRYMRFVFFSMRNFERQGGGTIRMYGVLNALADKGHEVVFVSNASNYEGFNPKISHIKIDANFSSIGKTIFQGLLGVLPVGIISIMFKKTLSKINVALEKASVGNNHVYFFEYLDNSLALVLKKNRKIFGYINDIHGVATIEFLYQMKNSTSLIQKIKFKLKYFVSNALDSRVFNNGDGFIYASEAMRNYFERCYPSVKNKLAYVVPNSLSIEAFNRTIDQELKTKLVENYNIDKHDFVFMFAGGYKPTAGVEDLIHSFSDLNKTYKNLRLILIGEGPSKDACLELIARLDLATRVTLIDGIPYSQLITYQSIANVIVCPDRENPYSNLIIHLKYLDALVSGKLVINGSFDSVMEINKDERLSINFEPSNQKSLCLAMKKCIDQYDFLTVRCFDNKKFASENLSYEACIDALTSI